MPAAASIASCGELLPDLIAQESNFPFEVMRSDCEDEREHDLHGCASEHDAHEGVCEGGRVHVHGRVHGDGHDPLHGGDGESGAGD